MKIACIADDYTGATDVAAALRSAGLTTMLHFGRPSVAEPDGVADAVVVGLKIRTSEPHVAVREALQVLDWFAPATPDQVYFKYCSTFDSTDRGNIGPIADALADRLDAGITVVCPASPEHNRSVYQGHLFVGDRLLSESSLRHHPLTPMTDPDLVRVLGRQTERVVALVAHEHVRSGADVIARELEGLRGSGIAYAVTDALTPSDLQAVANAAQGRALLTGAAGLARAAGSTVAGAASQDTAPEAELPSGPTVILAGSCSSSTLGQVDKALSAVPGFYLDPTVFDSSERMASAAIEWFESHSLEKAFVFYSSETKEQRARYQGDTADLAAKIESAMALIARHVVDRGVRRIVVAGGETSGAVISGLGVSSARVSFEADPGVPWLLSQEQPRLALLLKSGNFGTPDLLLRAAEAR